MAYYTLLQRYEGVWGVEFGDRDKATVEAERNDYRDHFVKAKDLKIVKTPTSRYAEVAPIVKALNERAKA